MHKLLRYAKNVLRYAVIITLCGNYYVMRRHNEVMRSGRLRWFGHVQRRDATNVTRRVMELAIPGTRRRGRPKKTWHQQMKEDPICGPRPEGVEKEDKADPYEIGKRPPR